MQMKKRILVPILTIVMIMIISACAADSGRSAEPAENGTEAVKSEVNDANKNDGGSINENEGIHEEIVTTDINNGTANNGTARGDAAGKDVEMNGSEPADQDTGATGGEPDSQNGMTGDESIDQDTGSIGNEAAGQTGKAGVKLIDQGMVAIGNEAAVQTGRNGRETADQTELTGREWADRGDEAADRSAEKEAEADGGTQAIKDEGEDPIKPGDAAGTETVSRILEGRIICIDPGHQSRGNNDTEPLAPGSDVMKAKVSSGTVGTKTRIPEYKLVLEVALKLRDVLEGYGATVIMTRTENDVDISNAERAATANDANADLYFRIHADGSTDKSIHGVSVLIPGNGHITDEYILRESEKAGGCILDGFVKATGAKSRGLKKRNDLSGFNWCRVPMALIELGFMTNAQEDVKLNSQEYQSKMADGMANGIIEYFTSK
jgi:N-acetylmuramoyl-L-alanine amidase